MRKFRKVHAVAENETDESDVCEKYLENSATHNDIQA